jgi:hypothetical protein
MERQQYVKALRRETEESDRAERRASGASMTKRGRKISSGLERSDKALRRGTAARPTRAPSGVLRAHKGSKRKKISSGLERSDRNNGNLFSGPR